MPPKTTSPPRSNNNIHSYHKPTHPPKKIKPKPRKEEASAATTTTLEPKYLQTINPSISKPPFRVLEEELTGSSSKVLLCLPLIKICGMVALALHS